MRIQNVEHSPFPQIKSHITTNLIFNKSEMAALKRASDILNKAEKAMVDFTGCDDLYDYAYDLSEHCNIAYRIEELLDDCHSEHGLRLL